MQRVKPPFRADHVGSLVRPDRVKEVQANFASGKISELQLQRVENIEIEKAVQRQQQSGFRFATDGEFRRSWGHFDFFNDLTGCELYQTDGIQFAGVTTRGESVRVMGKLDFPESHPMIEHFKLLKDRCDPAGIMPKMTLPAPSVLHVSAGRKGISQDAYPRLDDFFVDLAKTYRKAIKAFYDAGCRYLQFDDTAWGYLCSEEERAKLHARGDDVGSLAQNYARVINYAIAERPADMTITTHVSGGNSRSTSASFGGFEPIAETLFKDTKYDGYVLEYDVEQSGGFEPLRFLPRGNKIVVLGLVSSKTSASESRDVVKRRIAEAAKFVPLDQLALSTQCGFASAEEGVLTEEEQWSKLRLVADIAKEVWGAS